MNHDEQRVGLESAGSPTTAPQHPDGTTPRTETSPNEATPLDASVTVLTHYLPPYMSSVLRRIAERVRNLQVLLSIEQEPNRQFDSTWRSLQVEVQKSFMLRRPWRHTAGFQDRLFVHFPYDTLWQLRRRNPDIVFSYELGFRSLQSALYCKTHGKRLALCVCVSEHTERGRGRLRYLLRKLLLRWADTVTYNGPSCQRYLQRMGVPDSKLYPFPYACSEQFQYTGPVERSAEANHRLLYVGQMSERKGVVPLLQGLVSYCTTRPNQRVELTFAGAGELESALQGTPVPGNLRLTFLGHVDYEALSRAMERVGILIFPTLADEWGLVVNEAMQAGLPVIGSEYAQASTTLIQHGVNGWRYRPEHPEELHRCLDQAFRTDARQLLRMRQAAVATVGDITPERVAQQAIAMFRHLL